MNPRSPIRCFIAALAVILLAVQVGLGGITVLLELPAAVIVLHLATAMALFATLVVGALLARRNAPDRVRFIMIDPPAPPDPPVPLTPPDPPEPSEAAVARIFGTHQQTIFYQAVDRLGDRWIRHTQEITQF